MKVKIFNKVNIRKIIRSHFETLVNDNTKKVEFDDIFTFIVIPLICSSILLIFNVELKESATNIIITTLSILVGLLFNVIVIIFDIIKRDSTIKLKNKLLNQLLTNISYSIVISLLIIILTLLTFVDNIYLKSIANFFVYFFIGNYLMTVLMILKRMYILFINELEEIENNK